MLNTSPGLVSIAAIAVGVVLFGALLFFSLVSSAENEKRAARRAFALAWMLATPFWITGLVDFPYHEIAAGALLIVTAGVAAVFLLPTYPPAPIVGDASETRIDERDTMFSRRDLETGSKRFDEYYERNPDKKPPDDVFRSKPGTLSAGALFYDPVTFSAADAGFTTVEQLWPLVDGEPSREKTETDPAGISRFIERWACQIGAVSAGITELKDYHLYSVAGRGDRYGDPVHLDHKYAVAIAVEMDKRMVDSAPHGPTIMESAQQYIHAGMIAVEIAQFIRSLGYPARAHIDGNYRVVCPLVARDAGLGEIGRIGLLMTPHLGPRVRLSVVTTDLPLVPGAMDRLRSRGDPTMTDFCARCKKCAAACPSRAIPFDAPRDIDGTRRWRIDSEACFTYWCIAGTDCARCMSVCPYSHTDSFVHRVVRRGVRGSSVFRRLALAMDDFFYGKLPPSREPPEWTRGGTSAAGR